MVHSRAHVMPRCCLGLLLAAHISAFALAPLALGHCGQPLRGGLRLGGPRSLCMQVHPRDGENLDLLPPPRRRSSMKMTAPERGQGSMASRKQTFVEQAAAADLDQAELELKLASLKGELQAINSKMIATLRKRRKLLKQNTALRGGFVSEVSVDEPEPIDTFEGSVDTFCTAEEYDMQVAFRRLRVWSRGQAKFMESATVVHVRTGSRFEDDEDDPNASQLIEADEGDVFVFPYGVVVCFGLTEEQTEELQTVMRFCERRGYIEPEVRPTNMKLCILSFRPFWQAP